MSSQDSGTGRGARDGAAGVTVSSSPTSAVNWPDECRPVAASQLMSSVFVSKLEVCSRQRSFVIVRESKGGHDCATTSALHR